MALLNEILSNIPDDVSFESNVFIEPALQELIRHYNHKALSNPELQVIKISATGADLKEAIRRLSAEDQIELLYHYSASKNKSATAVVGAEELKEVEKVQLQSFALKALFITTFTVATLLAVFVMTAADKSNSLMNFVASVRDSVRYIFFSSK